MTEIKTKEEYRKFTLIASESYNNRQYDRALEQFKVLERHNPKNPKIHETLSYIYLKLNQVDLAEKEFHIALQLRKQADPSFEIPPTFDEMVTKLDSFEATKEKYLKLIRSEPSKETLMQTKTTVSLGMHLMAKGYFQKAQDILVDYKKRITPYINQ